MADILIRGMAKMPGNCRECMFAGSGGMRNELNVCMFSGESQLLLSHERMSKCPLVPLPEGHGRLGDLDSLYQALIAHEFTMTAGDMLEVIANAETIVPAEGGNADVQCL